jgi:hypothetical protein
MRLSSCLSRLARAALVAGLCGAALVASAAERDVVRTAVPRVPSDRLSLGPDAGEVPIETAPDWREPQPGVTRALVMIHGWPRRDLGSGARAVAAAGVAASGTIVVTPQFPAQVDVDAKGLAPRTLRWGVDAWPQGQPALAPAPISSFEVVDAILARLADRHRFPDLRVVVLAGHSAGGQFVQRYAVVGRGEAALSRAGIHLRYVVANPSTYLYIAGLRPVDGGAECRSVDRWKYGLRDAPAYVARPIDAAALLEDYRRRDVVYLLGTADTDPRGDGLDRSCAAEAQGPTRFARGLAFVARLKESAPDVPQQVLQVPAVGHHGGAMFTSAEGLRALFGDGAGAGGR